MKSLSIFLLGTQMTIGGAQRVLLDQAQWFHDHGYKVTVAFFYDKDGLFNSWKDSHEFPILNLQAYDPKVTGFKQAVLLMSGLGKLWRIIRLSKIDALITYTHDSNMLGLPVAWAAGVPVRIGTHLGAIRGMPRWREKIHSLLINIGCAQVLVAASKGTYQKSLLEGISPERIEIIPNGIQPFQVDPVQRRIVRGSLGLQEGDIFLLSVGRLVYEKGHEYLIRAMAEVVQQFPAAKAGICGSGPLYEFLESLIDRNKLDDRVKLLGKWDEIPHLLAAADIFILPSRWEGLPMALLEGMMASLPVIATRVDGVEEVIVNGAQGLLVPLEDADALGKAILQLLSDPEKRALMGSSARARVFEGYTTERMCEQYMTLIMK
ncbi:MAG: glycosyltransferase family 4 protein, partial [Anaerolineales bacterium]|nr:glycosyltransferase family 4 protein [Anaerolineales bacterium]